MQIGTAHATAGTHLLALSRSTRNVYCGPRVAEVRDFAPSLRRINHSAYRNLAIRTLRTRTYTWNAPPRPGRFLDSAHVTAAICMELRACSRDKRQNKLQRVLPASTPTETFYFTNATVQSFRRAVCVYIDEHAQTGSGGTDKTPGGPRRWRKYTVRGVSTNKCKTPLLCIVNTLSSLNPCSVDVSIQV